MKEITKQSTIHLFGIMAIVSAFAFTNYYAQSKNYNDWIDKKMSVISCNPNGSTGTGSSSYSKMGERKISGNHKAGNDDPSDRNNGNGCSHQQGVGYLCNMNKRRVRKM